MNNIGKFQLERMVFNNDAKEVLHKMAKRSEIKVSYYDEYHETDELFFVDGERYTLYGINSYVISKTSNKSTKSSTKNNTKRPKIGL